MELNPNEERRFSTYRIRSTFTCDIWLLWLPKGPVHWIHCSTLRRTGTNRHWWSCSQNQETCSVYV